MANGKKNDEIPSVAALLRNDDVPFGEEVAATISNN